MTTVPVDQGVIDFNVPAEFGAVLTPRRLGFDPQTFTETQTFARSNFLTTDINLTTDHRFNIQLGADTPGTNGPGQFAVGRVQLYKR